MVCSIRNSITARSHYLPWNCMEISSCVTHCINTKKNLNECLASKLQRSLSGLSLLRPSFAKMAIILHYSRFKCRRLSFLPWATFLMWPQFLGKQDGLEYIREADYCTSLAIFACLVLSRCMSITHNSCWQVHVKGETRWYSLSESWKTGKKQQCLCLFFVAEVSMK